MENTFRKKGEFVARVIAGETIVVPIRGRVGDLDSIYNLNEVASLVWERIDGRTPASGLTAAVIEEFEVSAEQARADTLAFLEDLEAAGLVEAC